MRSIDALVLLLYAGFLLYLGIKVIRKSAVTTSLDFLLGGRSLTLPAFVATLVSTWYGGILGVGEFTYRFGISNWLVFGVPYYLAAVVFALLIAKKARREELYTIPQQIDRVYGKSPSLLSAGIIFLMTTPAAYVLMLGVLMQFFFNLPLWICIVIGTLFSTVYVFIGGFRSVVKTDELQFSLMFAGFLIITILSIVKFGGIDFLRASLPAQHFSWHGGQGAGYIFVWYFIALATMIEPAFYQRCFAAKNESVAKKGILVSVLFWVLFDFLTTTSGLYARAVLPHLQNPVTSYLELGKTVLPPFVYGLFLAGLLSTIMSTVDSYTFVAAMTLGRDVFARMRNNMTDAKINSYTKIGIIISGILSIAIAMYGKSVIRIWKDLGSIGTPALLLPTLSSFWPRFKMSNRAATLAMLSGAAVSGFWILSKELPVHDKPGYLLGVEPIYAGLFITSIIYIVDRIFKK